MWFMIISFLCLGVLSIGVIIWLDKSTPSKAKQGGISKGHVKLYTKYFNWYENFFLTRGGIRLVYGRVCELSVYTSAEGRVVAVKFYTLSLSIFIGLLIAGAIIFKDLFSWLLVLLFAVVMKTMLVDKQIDKIHLKLLQQLLQALSSVRENYLRLNSIPDAIAEAEVGALLRRAFDDIYLILTAVDNDKRLEEFYASTPFRAVQTLASVCYQINESGDSVLTDGTSNFLQAMSMMESEVQLEVEKLLLLKAKFGILEIMPIAPLAAIRGIEVFFTGTIPGTTVLYHGPMGYLAKVVIILTAILGYSIIVKINSAVPVRKDDRSALVLSLLEHKWFLNLCIAFTPKKTKKLLGKTKVLKGALSMIDIQHLYGKKITAAFIAFCVTLFFLVFAMNLGKEFVYNNVAEASLVAGDPLTKEETVKRERMDEIYMKLPTLPSEHDTEIFVDKYLPDLEEYDRQAQIHRLQVKYKTYFATTFKWWMILICYIAAIGGWWFPEIGLKSRAWLLKTESEEDVLQMQTLIAILMNTSIDTMDAIFWLWKQSRVYSRILLAAYHEYASEPEMALNTLKEKASSGQFKRIVDKLKLTIHQITLAEAFSDLISERNHILNIRKIIQTAAVMKKRALASPLAMAPLYLTAFAYILLPLGILGVQEFMSAMKQMHM